MKSINNTKLFKFYIYHANVNISNAKVKKKTALIKSWFALCLITWQKKQTFNKFHITCARFYLVFLNIKIDFTENTQYLYICQTIKIGLRCKSTLKTRNLHSLNTKDIVYVYFDWTYLTILFLHKTVKRERSRLYCIVCCRIKTAFYSSDSVQHSRVSTHKHLSNVSFGFCYTCLCVRVSHFILFVVYLMFRATSESAEWYNTFGSWRNVSRNLSHKWNVLRFADFSHKCIVLVVYAANTLHASFGTTNHTQFHQASGSR